MLTETAPAAEADPAGPLRPDRPAWPAPGPRTENALLAAILLLAGGLYGRQVAHAQFHSFYATAVKSMTLSWKAFVFGSLDPAGSITIDKIPGFLWPQALSARVFGFHPWALALPQAVGGLLAVYVLGRTVRRWAGPAAGLLAAAILALTPVAASVFGKALEDAALTVLLVFAAHAATRAVDTGRLRHLLLAGVWVGLAFQAKMLQSWAVVPAFGLAYLVAAPVAVTRRLLHLLAAGAVTVAVSFSWMVLTVITPAHDRPYIDGSTNNNAFAMVIGYNGLARFSQVGLSAAGTGSVVATQGGFGGGHLGEHGTTGAGRAGAAGGSATGTGTMPLGAGAGPSQSAGTTGAAKTGTTTTPGSGTGHALAGRARTGVRAAAGGAANGGAAAGTAHAGTSGAQAAHGATTTTTGAAATTAAPAGFHPGQADSGTTGWSKLFGSPLASQVGWLYPLVGMAIVTGFWWRRRQPRTDPVRAGYLVWTGWLVTTGLGLSAGSVAHSTYVVALAPALAAIAAAGLSTYLAEWRHPSSPGRAWALPVALALTALWSWHVSAHYPMFLPWLVPGTLAVTALAAGALTWRTLAARGARPVPARIPALAVGAGVLALLAPAAAWSLSVLDSAYAGSSGNASAGPYDSGFGGAGFSAGGGGGGAGGAHAVAAGSLRRAAAPAGMMNPFDPPATLDTAQQHLLAYLTAHRAGAKYLLATQSWSAAAPFIMNDGASILPMGGFSGDADLPTPAQFRTLVDTGNDRYVLLSGSGFMGRGGPGLQAVIASVAKTCALVPAADYDGVTGQTAPLYHCAASEG